MDARLETRVERLIGNVQEVRKEFFWQDTLTKYLAALLYALEDRAIDVPGIRESHSLIKAQTGVFSMFRGNMVLSLAALLSLTQEQDRILADTLQVYTLLKEAKFYASEYLVMASHQIASHAAQENYAEVIRRARAFYEGMKTMHPLLTGQDDYLYSTMFGLSDMEVQEGLERIEALYAVLKPEFHYGNRVQTLAQVLALGGEGPDVLERVQAMNAAFRAQDLRLDKEYTLSLLGLLTLLCPDTNAIAFTVEDVMKRLSLEKGFGGLTLTKQQCLLFATSLVASIQAEDAKNHLMPALSTSITNILIAQEAAIAAVTAASIASAASSSSNG